MAIYGKLEEQISREQKISNNRIKNTKSFSILSKLLLYPISRNSLSLWISLSNPLFQIEIKTSLIYQLVPSANFYSFLFSAQVIPAERRGPEKEETWTLAPDQSGVDACPFLDDVLPDVKSKPIQDDNPQPRIHDPGDTQSQSNQQLEHPDCGTLPRSQETRKSKTKKVKSYLRKCKGALSKADEASTEKKRQEHCTSWYLDESHQEEDNPVMEIQKQNSELLEERIAEEEASPLEDGRGEDPSNLSKEESREDEESVSRLAEDLRRSRTSLYEDARDSMHDRECAASEEGCCKRDDAISLETLTTEETTNLNKCDSNDTLIACEVAAPNGPPPLVEEGKEGEEADGEMQALSLFGVSSRRVRSRFDRS